MAFVALKPGTALDLKAMRDRLSRRLPSYMVPRRLQIVTSIPVTRNGKADHQALLAQLDNPIRRDAALDRQNLTPTESKLLDLWTTVLQSEPPSPESSFFACGGSSLLAAQLASSIERSFRISFPFCQLDELDTLRAQATWLDGRSTGEGDAPRRFQITSYPKRKYNDIKWKWAESLGIERRPKFAGCMLIPRAFTLQGELDVPAFRAALQSLVDSHDVLRSRIVILRGEERLLVADKVQVEIDEQDFSALGPEKALAEARSLFDADCVSKISLTSYPLYRIRLVKLARHRHFFIFLLHHGIGDARSLEIAFRHVAAAYNQATGAAASGPDLPAFSFLDYQDSFLRWYDQGQKDADAAFWERTLAGSKPHRLPMEEDFAITGHSPATMYHRALDPEWAEGLRRFCRDHQASPFAFLATAWQILLRRYTGEPDTPISLPPDIRMTPESVNIMGNFGNLIFIRPDFSASDSFATALRATRQALLRSLDHKCYPLSEIRKVWIPKDDARQDPLKQTMVTEADSPDALNLNGIDVEPADRVAYTSISKLNLFIRLSRKRPTLAFSAPDGVLRPGAMERLIYHFQDFAQRAMAQPDLPCGDFPDLRSGQAARVPLNRTERETSILQPIDPRSSSSVRPKAKPAPKPPALKATERRLASIWESILGKAPASIDASFYDLGGSSLSAARLLHALREEFSLALEFEQFDAHPTIRKQALLIDHESSQAAPRQSRSFAIAQGPARKFRPVRWRWKESMWLESLENPIHLLIARAFVLVGQVDPARLKAGLQSLVDAQVQLRSRIVERNGEPRVQILDRHAVELDCRDLSELGEAEARVKAMNLFEQDSGARLSIASFPLYRFRLLRIGPEKHLFTFLLHHGISDARSLEVSFRHLSHIYNGMTAPATPPSYFDYEESFLQWFGKRRQKEAERYWSKLLSGAPVAPLSIENPIPITKPCQAAIHTRPLQAAWASRFLDFCAEHRISDFVFLATLWRVLLARYGASLSMPVSFSTDIRLTEEADQIIGHFGNVILLRHEIDPNASLQCLMAATKQALHRSLEHKALDYLYIKRCSEDRPYDDVRLRPSNQTMIMKADTSSALQLQGVEVHPIHRKVHTTMNKINLFIRLEDRVPTLAFSSPAGLFDPTAYQRLMHHFQEFIQRAIESPEVTFRELPDYRDRQAASRPLTATEGRSSIFEDA